MEVAVKDHPGLVRDSQGFIKNTDRDAFLAYIQNREKIQKDAEKIETLEGKVDQLTELVKKLLGEKNE